MAGDGQPGSSANLESAIRDKVDNITYLPTTAAVAMKFVELGKNAESDPADYARVISSDSSLSSKLLSLANSSWFGVRNKITKPNMAVNLLGLGTVRTLAISYCVTGLHSELRLSAEESRMFWSASLCKALAARLFASRRNERQAEEAFAAALFQDFAIPLMFSCAREEVLALLDDATISAQARLQRERQLFRHDHAEIGRLLAQKLELPEMFMDAVAFHHNRERLREMIAEPVITDAAHLASLFPHRLDVWNREDAEEIKQFLAAQQPPIDHVEFLAALQTEFNRMYAFFEQGQVPAARLRELLEAATREAAANAERLVGTVQELMQRVVATGGVPALHAAAAGSAGAAAPAGDPSPAPLLDRGALGAHVTALATEALQLDAALACIGVYLGAPSTGIYLDVHEVSELIHPLARPGDALGRLSDDGLILAMPVCTELLARRTGDAVLKALLAAAGSAVDAAGRPAVGVAVLWMNPNGGTFTTDKMLSGMDWLLGQARGGQAARVHFAKIVGKPKAASAPA